MSQYILCKGKIPIKELEGVILYCYPFGAFYNQVCEYFWKGKNKDDIWTIEVDEHTAIDHYFTEAQEQIGYGIEFDKTNIYIVLKQLLNYNIEIIMWYDVFYDDIPIVYSGEELLKEVFNGITDKSGMCEVYVKYENIK